MPRATDIKITCIAIRAPLRVPWRRGGSADTRTIVALKTVELLEMRGTSRRHINI
jgi:hypothetical protein